MQNRVTEFSGLQVRYFAPSPVQCHWLSPDEGHQASFSLHGWARVPNPIADSKETRSRFAMGRDIDSGLWLPLFLHLKALGS